MSKFTLNEDLFDDLDIIDIPPDDLGGILMFNDQVKAPDNDIDMGISNMILDCIQSETNSISQYNGVLVTLRDMSNNESMCEVIEEIIADYNRHIGQLQALLQKVSPNAELITMEKEDTSIQLDEGLNSDGTLDWSGFDDLLKSTMNTDPNEKGEVLNED